MTKKLYRSRENKIISGVLGGIGEYFDVDPVLFRLVYLLITVFTGIIPGILVYILAILMIPLRPETVASQVVHDSTEV